MIKFINSWAQGVILAVIIATIIEIILPEGNNKKYIKTVIGIYILFSIIYPLITKVSNTSIDISSIITNSTKEISKYDNSNITTIETNAYIENTYKNRLKKDIKDKLEEKGYNLLNLNLYIETEREESYGQINSIIIKVEKNSLQKEEANIVNSIEQIDISLSNNRTEKIKESKEISKEEIKVLKEYLSSTYSIEIEKIHVND